MVSRPLRDLLISAQDVERFSGKAPPLASYALRPVEDQGQQYELAMAFDETSDDEEVEDEAEEVNPFYGIPFGLSMLVVNDDAGDAAGFITFRNDLRVGDTDDEGRPVAAYDFKVFVFMVREDLRGMGYGSSLAIGALSTIRHDLEDLSRPENGTERPVVALRFVGEGKSAGGLRLLNRVARNLGVLSDQVRRTHGLSFSQVAAEILTGRAA